jgi:hypothetical protein
MAGGGPKRSPLSLTGFLTIINGSIFDGFRKNTGATTEKAQSSIFLAEEDDQAFKTLANSVSE